MSERSVRRLQTRWIAEDKEAVDKALGALLGVKEGRRYLYLQLLDLGFFQSPFVNNALVTAFQSGKQAVALDLFNRLSGISPDHLTQLIKENQHVQENRIKEAAMAGADGGDTEPSAYLDSAIDAD